MNLRSAGALSIASCTRFDAITPPNGKYPLVTPLANETRSASTPQWPSANHLPVRPNPVITSSAMCAGSA